MTGLIFHMCRRDEWDVALSRGSYTGSSQDRQDGFIHFSTAEQLAGSARRHRAGQPNIVLLAADPALLGDTLKWEPSRRGALFPHLYGPLPVSAVRWARDLPLGDDRLHILPSLDQASPSEAAAPGSPTRSLTRPFTGKDSPMAFREQLIEYRCGDTLLEGYFCFDDELPGPLPAVIITHDWSGRGEFVEKKAHRLAYHGFAVFALDMYGKGKRGTTQEECQALMTPLVTDRALLAKRINAALTQVKTLPQVDARRVAAMGFCFGGLCALDLARSGADLRGVVSIHGLLKPNGLPPPSRVNAKILMLHGYDDPMAPPEDVLAIAKEFKQAGADWQLHAYGGTMHAFTNPNANDAAGGMLYSEKAHRRSWHSLMAFLDEVLR